MTYRPIACQNLMFKLYTRCINIFFQHHCEINNIITSEQGAGKRVVWGCVEQLLINKTLLNEVRSNQHNLIAIWLDYQKAFNMDDKCMHKWRERLVRIKHHKVFERPISRRQPICSAVYLIVKSNVIPFE